LSRVRGLISNHWSCGDLPPVGCIVGIKLPTFSFTAICRQSVASPVISGDAMVLVVSRLRTRNPGQTCGKERQSGQAIKCTATVIGRFGRRKLFLATCLLLSSIGDSFAHTVSIGYEALGGGVFDVWYGTYHSGVNFTEGSLQLVGPSISTTVAFTMLVTTKPSGLIDVVARWSAPWTTIGSTKKIPIKLETCSSIMDFLSPKVNCWWWKLIQPPN
jgi:hypothetical protein